MPVHEENTSNYTGEATNISRDRGKQPAAVPNERTPLFSTAEREAMRREMADDESSGNDTLALPDSALPFSAIVHQC